MAGRDPGRPYIPPRQRRATALDVCLPAAVAIERKRLEAEQRRREAIRTARELEPEAEQEELGEGERQRVKRTPRRLRGG